MKIPFPYIEIAIDRAASLNDDENRSLSGELNSIGICYTFLLGKLHLPKIKKIRIEFSDSPYAQFGIAAPVKFSPMIGITSGLEFYNEMKGENDKGTRWRKILQVIHGILVQMCNDLGYDVLPFEAVYKTLQSNCDGVIIPFEKVPSKDKSLIAQLQTEIKLKNVVVSILISKSDGQIVKRIPVVAVLPSLYFIDRIVGKLSWKNNSDLILKSKNLGIDFSTTLSEETVHFVNSVSEKAQALAEIELQLMSPELRSAEKISLLEKRAGLIPG